MRTVGLDTDAALKGSGLDIALLITMEFASGTLRLTTSNETIDVPPDVYTGIGLLGKIGTVDDKAKELASLEFTITGVDPAVIALALGEQVRGRPMQLEMAVVTAVGTTHTITDVVPLWAGQMSTVQLAQQENKATIKIVAEHRGVLFTRTKPLRYTNADQQRLYPGDRSLEYIVSQSQSQDIWPAASFFRI